MWSREWQPINFFMVLFFTNRLRAALLLHTHACMHAYLCNAFYIAIILCVCLCVVWSGLFCTHDITKQIFVSPQTDTTSPLPLLLLMRPTISNKRWRRKKRFIHWDKHVNRTLSLFGLVHCPRFTFGWVQQC